jgi:hypothetical protein
MNTIGRLMQIAALGLLPLAMLMQLTDSLGDRGLATMLTMMIFGVALFYAGIYVQSLFGNRE